MDGVLAWTDTLHPERHPDLADKYGALVMVDATPPAYWSQGAAHRVYRYN
jgi:hypothetical protein